MQKIQFTALLLLILALPAGAFAQTDSIYAANKWCAKKDTLLLFKGGNNVIQIYSRAFKPADIKIKSLDKSLRIGIPEIKGDTLNVIAMPFPEKGKNMRILIQDKKTSKQIKTLSFTSDTIPTLVAHVGNLQVTEALRKDILAQLVLKLAFPGSLYSYPYTIKQYTLKAYSPTGGITIPVKGIFLTRDVLQAISTVPAGTVVEFTNIQATCPECATHACPDIKLKVR